MKIGKKTGFTLVEILIVVTLLIFILYFAYQIFFSQTRAVTQTIDALQTNEGLRRVLAFVGDDVRESTRIVKPTPIKLEDVPSGQEYLAIILDAMKTNNQIRITYQGYKREESYTFVVHPYCVKMFKQRWYMLAFCPYYNKMMTYALDRIIGIWKLDGETFEMPHGFDSEEYFANYYGIISGTGTDLYTVKLKLSKKQANYLRSLPLHKTQKEVERTDEYSIFTLQLCPVLDFQQEILSMGEEVEVLEPIWLRKEIAGKVKKTWNIYNNQY